MQTKCHPHAHQLVIEVVSAHLSSLIHNTSASHKCNPHLILCPNTAVPSLTAYQPCKMLSSAFSPRVFLILSGPT